jgi:hypothetical protein
LRNLRGLPLEIHSTIAQGRDAMRTITFLVFGMLALVPHARAETYQQCLSAARLKGINALHDHSALDVCREMIRAGRYQSAERCADNVNAETDQIIKNVGDAVKDCDRRMIDGELTRE